MAITFIANSNAWDQISPNVPKPAAVQSGDMLLVCTSVVNGSLTALPSGFSILTQINNASYSQHIAYKIAGGSEPSSYTFNTNSPSLGARAVMVVYRGQHVNSITDARATNFVSSSGSFINTPTVSDLSTGLAIFFYGLRDSNDQNISPSAPSGTTTRFLGGTGFNPNITICDIGYFGGSIAGTAQHATTLERMGSIVVIKQANVAPNTPTNLQRTGLPTDTTPNFSADISDPDTSQQIKARFEVFENDESTLIGTVDSTLQAGAHTATAEFSPALGVGEYKIRAKAIDDAALESGYTSFVSFIVKQSEYWGVIPI